ncbi:type II toxin-antitoxin system PemK/MazF family toxin [Candidatus Kaiserbacteria bacterium]|nr:type II toxin-antitoxin system PemK/MazF family toxin [Candidatus Kaiserbacteria bacterium]
MRQGEIWYAQLNPVKGSEQGGRRPVVIISGNTMNETLPVVIVCSMSTKIKEYPGCVILRANKGTGLKQDSEVVTFQVRTLAHARLTKKVGVVTSEEFRAILQGLQEVLVL